MICMSVLRANNEIHRHPVFLDECPFNSVPVKLSSDQNAVWLYLEDRPCRYSTKESGSCDIFTNLFKEGSIEWRYCCASMLCTFAKVDDFYRVYTIIVEYKFVPRVQGKEPKKLSFQQQHQHQHQHHHHHHNHHQHHHFFIYK